MRTLNRDWTGGLVRLTRWAGLGLLGPLAGCAISSEVTPIPAAPEGCARTEPYAVEHLQADLTWLASPELDGRAPGSTGDGAARDALTARFECLGLIPLGDLVGYEQPFTTSEGDETANVLGVLEGVEAGLADEVLLISAHHDHLGDGYLGANDNASGVAALLAIAQSLVDELPGLNRTVIFAAFGAEELGYEGSEAFMADPPAGFDPETIVYNLNLDMVGSYTQSDVLYVLGSFSGTEGRAEVEVVAQDHPDLVLELGDESAESDNASFCTRGVPYLFFWTDDPDCYHERCDTADRIDYPALSEIAALVGETALALANSGEALSEGVDSDTDVCAQ